MNTIRTYNSHTSKTILNFIKNLVSKSTYKNISFLLSPCCSLGLASVANSCVSSGSSTYNITATLSSGGSFLGHGVATITIPINSYYSITASTPYVDNSTSIVFSSVKVPAGTYSPIITISTNTGNQSVIVSSNSVSSTFSAC